LFVFKIPSFTDHCDSKPAYSFPKFFLRKNRYVG
jgi:hypothetical protein